MSPGLLHYDPDGRRSVRYSAKENDPNSLSSNSIRALFIDARKRTMDRYRRGWPEST